VFAGTSAAAPYVGGVAALIQDQYRGDASPKEVETALESTSDDIRRSGSDTISGAGVVNAVDAVDSVNISTTTSTLTPIADAGSNQTVKTGTVVRLNATGSSDPDSDTLSYVWTKISGPPVTLSGASTVTPEFTPTVAGTYTFELTVSDGTASDTDSVTVTVGSPLEAAPGKFDSDGDGTISQTELTEAAFAFATGQVSQAELSEVAFAFATE
jgi:hypothetical protein